MNNFFDKKYILITGGLGFIGSHLTRKLNQLGAQVEVFDRKLGFDIENQDQLEFFTKKKFDIIFHLAGMSGTIKNDLLDFLKINTYATVLLTKLISENSPKTKLVISGTRLEYGIPQYLPVDENHLTIPNSYYGWSKLTGSETALDYGSKNGVDVVIFRTSNVYGPHLEANFKGYNVINHFVDLAMQDLDLEIFGDGLQERDQIYVDDVVEGFLLGAQKSKGNQIYNLGYGQGVTFKEMVELIIKVVGKGKIKYREWPENYKLVETGSYITDITKIKKLGFTPKIGFAEGISKMLESV